MKITLGNREFYIQNRRLDLNYANITQDELTALCNILKTDNRIISLNLNGSNIGDAGAKAIAEAIKVNKTITYLDLSDNNIGDAGAKAIAEAIKVNKTITYLHLQKNNIRADGTKALDELVIKNTHLFVCFYNDKSTAANQELDARLNAFVYLVSNLAKNEPYTSAISEIQFQWLNNHGKEFWNYISDANKISCEDFETKWQTILEEKSYKKFEIEFNRLIQKDLTDFNNSSMLQFHGKFTYENGTPIKFEIPKDVMRNMFNQLTLQEKIDQLTR